jgi:CDP-glucose 4,6-dehydratase
VEDGALAYLVLAEQLAARRELAGEAFNFSNEIQVTVLEFAGLILRLMHRQDLELDVRGEATNEIPHQYLDAAKARETLDWKPQFSLEEGLRRTIAWYSSFFADKEGANDQRSNRQTVAADIG